MRHRALAAYAALLLISIVWSSNARSAERKLTGSVEIIRGITVLTLTGSPRENGYARGYLLAREVLDGVKGAFDVLLPGNTDYKKISKAILPALQRTEAHVQEVEGIVEGLRAKFGGEALAIPRIGRELSADDFWVLMSLPDVRCSSFAVWGRMLEGEGMLVGRNLDYPGKEVAAASKVLFVYKSPEPGRRSWVDPLPWLIGVTTGIGEDGVFFSVHDSENTGKAEPPGHLRFTVLREFLETVSAKDDLAAQAGAFFRKHHILRGTNFLLCGPRAPACVLEYDGNLAKEDGVTVRLPEAGQEWIAVTNHFRTRNAPDICPRYAKLEESLKAMAAGGKKIMTMQEAWELLRGAGKSTTLLSVVFRSADRKLLLSFTDGRSPAHELKPVEFSLDELLGPKAAK